MLFLFYFMCDQKDLENKATHGWTGKMKKMAHILLYVF